jgi:hypothetical protein
MRLPKFKGFKSRAKEVTIFSLDVISKNFKDGDVVTLAKLEEKKLISKGDKVKILNNGKLTVAVTFEVPCSKSISTSAKTIEKKNAQKADEPKDSESTVTVADTDMVKEKKAVAKAPTKTRTVAKIVKKATK